MEFSNYQYNYESFIKVGILMTANTTFIIQAENILLLNYKYVIQCCIQNEKLSCVNYHARILYIFIYIYSPNIYLSINKYLYIYLYNIYIINIYIFIYGRLCTVLHFIFSKYKN